jgi:hypothetical protein
MRARLKRASARRNANGQEQEQQPQGPTAVSA